MDICRNGSSRPGIAGGFFYATRRRNPAVIASLPMITCTDRIGRGGLALAVPPRCSRTEFGARADALPASRYARPGRRHRDPRRGASVRRPGVDRRHRRRDDPRRTARDQPVRIAGARSRRVRGQPQQLRAGPADQLARLRRARDVRRARRAPVPGRHSGDDAGRAGADRQLQPAFREAHRSAARAVLHAVRQCVGRRDLGVHRGRHADAGRRTSRRVSAATARRTSASRPPGSPAASGYVAAFSNFDTDGYRDHSAALRQIANAKLTFDATRSDARHADRQLAIPAADAGSARPDATRNGRPIRGRPIRWRRCSTRTRRSTRCKAASRSTRCCNADTSLRVTGYGGQRQIRQYLALSGVGATSSGGVVDLDRNFGGVGARSSGAAASWTGR